MWKNKKRCGITIKRENEDDVNVDYTRIYNFRMDYIDKTAEPYLKFNANCHNLVFNMFRNIPGYRSLIKYINTYHPDSIQVNMRWIQIDEYYNRCCGVVIDRKVKV